MRDLREFKNLREALKIVDDLEMQELERIVESEPKPVYSNKFKKRMAKMLKYADKPYFRFVSTAGKRAAVWVVMIMTVLLTTTFSVKAIREPVVRFITEVFEKFTSIVFVVDEDSEQGDVNLPTEIEKRYYPKNIPNNYSISNDIVIGDMAMVAYSASGESDITFQQYIITRQIVQADTEGIEFENVEVNEYGGIYFVKNGVDMLIWIDGEYGYTLSGNCGKDTLMSMTELSEKNN